MYHTVIMCGGSGTRLWPLTRQAMPKQFLPLTTEKPLFVETVERLRRSVQIERIWVVTSAMHAPLVRQLVPDLPAQNVIGEPIARNSTGAVGLAMARVRRHDPEAVLTVLPSDHIMTRVEQFDAALALGAKLALSGATVCTGVTPDRPETGYGYVERGRQIEAAHGVVAFEVKRFVEKPDAERAAEFVRSGMFLWNAGIFTWRVDTLRDLLAKHLPGSVETFERTDLLLDSDPQAALKEFAALPNISIDYAVIEKTDNRIVVECDPGWLDIGGWGAVYDATRRKDAQGNVLPELGIAVDARGCYFSTSRPKLVAAIGVENLVVVDTDDALLVCHRERAQDVRKVIEQVKNRGMERFL